ncbi:MAG: FtsL-like putative cell division protein [Bacteroidota bacterium]
MKEENLIPEQPVKEKFDWKKIFNHTWVVKNIPFFLFLAVLAVLYIYNGHYADKLARKMSATEKHISELEFEYKTIKSEVIYRSKASELAKAVEPLGLKELTEPPILLGNDSTLASVNP